MNLLIKKYILNSVAKHGRNTVYYHMYLKFSEDYSIYELLIIYIRIVANLNFSNFNICWICVLISHFVLSQNEAILNYLQQLFKHNSKKYQLS